MSCAQAGSAGPPFHPATAADRLPGILTRWFPWNWHSIDGSGWCYNTEWDRMQRCSEMDIPADWSGVGYPPAEPWELPFHARVLLGAVTCVCALLGYAFFLQVMSGDSQPSVCQWLRGQHALPWYWDSRVRGAAFGAAAGLFIGMCTPLPHLHITIEAPTASW